MLQKLILFSVLVIGSSAAIFGQSPTEPKRTENDEKVIKAAIAFLRETSADVDRMRSIENRLSFSAELASLMWFHDEKAARVMYQSAISDFRMLLAGLDARMNSSLIDEDESQGFGFFGRGRSPAERKITIAMLVRQQIAMGLAEHDPDLAYNFFYETAAMISNPAFRETNQQSDRQFETQLIRQIAEKDAAKGLKYGKASLKDKFDVSHVELLKKIYEKDAEQGIEFGEAVLSKIRSEPGGHSEIWTYSRLLEFGTDSLAASKKPDGKKPVYSQNDLREIADIFGQALLAAETEEVYSILEYLEQIERHSPSRAAQIRTKYKVPRETKTFVSSNMAANAMAMAASNTANMSGNSNMMSVREAELERQREARDKEMAEGMKSLGKELPKDERDKIVARARTLISETKGTEAKIAALSMLAAQVAKAGDIELADEIMLDADRMVDPLPKNYRDFLLSWLLAAGYAESNPNKAFPLLEGTIMRANETIAAFAKVAEFIDVQEEIISDGEVQVGAFGGTMLRGMTREIGIANMTLMSLARADFEKTKAVTERFDRIEVRVLAKMLVLRAVLDEKKPVPAVPSEVTITTRTSVGPE